MFSVILQTVTFQAVYHNSTLLLQLLFSDVLLERCVVSFSQPEQACP